MNELKVLAWVLGLVALFVLWAGVPSDGQPFHEPGQSDRSVVLTP